MVFLKRLGYVFFLGIVTFVLIGALVGFMEFALKTPLMFLGAISPIKNIFFLFSVGIVIFFLAGMGMDWILKHGFSFLNRTSALTEDGSVVFVMGEEITRDGKRYMKVLKPITHPIPGFLELHPAEKIVILNNPPTEMVKVIMSNGLIRLGYLEFEGVEQGEEKG